MSLMSSGRRRHEVRLRGPRRGILEGTEQAASPGHRLYVVAFHRSPEDARASRDGVVTTYADHATAPTRITLVAPGPGDWWVNVLERAVGTSGFTFGVAAEAVPLLRR